MTVSCSGGPQKDCMWSNLNECLKAKYGGILHMADLSFTDSGMEYTVCNSYKKLILDGGVIEVE